MSKARFWLSYDLGINGDYDGLYRWLDSHGAKECGSSMAYISNYEYEGTLDKAINGSLSQAVQISKRSRIYLVLKLPGTDAPKGLFLFGGRRPAPWDGYAPSASGEESDEG